MAEAERLVLPRMPTEPIPYHATLGCMNFSWRDFCTLMQQSFERLRKAFHRRGCFNSTETFAIAHHYYPGGQTKIEGFYANQLALYSITDQDGFDLSPVPYPEGILCGFQCVALDGKVYILGGLTRGGASNKVYFLDLAGQREWQRSASMVEPRLDFGAGVLNGKIYVFGGSSFREPVLGCEVYDPKDNAWSSTAPMTKGRVHQKVAVIGEELFVYAGQHFVDFTALDDSGIIQILPHPYYSAMFDTLVLDVYHPSKNVWRQIEPSEQKSWEKVFTAGGKFHKISNAGISAYDLDDDSWSHMQSFENVPGGFTGLNPVGPSFTIALGQELLFVDYFTTWNISSDRASSEIYLYQSRGFGKKNGDIVWEPVHCSLLGSPTIFSLSSPSLHLIRL